MKMPIAQSKNGVLAQSISAENGAAEHEVSLNIKHKTAAVLLAIRLAAISAINLYEVGKQVLRSRKAALDAAYLQVRIFVMLARDILKPIFGNLYHEGWDVTGFTGALAAPENVDDLLVLLLALKDFFTANPTLEFAEREVTAAQAQLLYNALNAANAAVNSQEATVGALKEVRDVKLELVGKSLRDLINELAALMGPLDPRWKAFGFNMPGAEETPDAVEGVIVALIGPTTAALKWPAPARAAFYHVFRRILGVDADWVLIGSPADIDFNIENLPANAHVDIAVSAVNAGGEGARSETVTIVTH
ncbi:MAG: hypothetical protein JWM68_98 [Verrucomicrobiales bacterium]|nr:hypothetical protein [Verrucomicrobiales bacterium]